LAALGKGSHIIPKSPTGTFQGGTHNDRRPDQYPLEGDVCGLSDRDCELFGPDKPFRCRAGPSAGTATFPHATGIGPECFFLVLCNRPDSRRACRGMAEATADISRCLVAMVHPPGLDDLGDILCRVGLVSHSV